MNYLTEPEEILTPFNRKILSFDQESNLNDEFDNEIFLTKENIGYKEKPIILLTGITIFCLLIVMFCKKSCFYQKFKTCLFGVGFFFISLILFIISILGLN